MMEDRRKRKTRKSIRDALLNLMMNKSFESITVNDIADYADINRGTFYLHYQDKYELLESIENEMLQMFIDIQSNVNIDIIKNNPTLVSDKIMKEIMRMVKGDVLFFRVIFMSGEKTSFESKFKKLIYDNFRQKLAGIVLVDDIPLKYYLAFVINAQLGVVKEWVKTGMQESPEDVADYAFKLGFNGPLRLMHEHLNAPSK